MSRRYKGAIISATPPTITASAASGEWTLQQQMQAIETAWPYGGPYRYVEDVFSTYTPTTPGGAYSVPNGIDFTNNGGLVWARPRALASNFGLYGKTSTGNFVSELLNSTAAATTGSTYLTASTNGFTDNTNTSSGRAMVYWSFRKQAKFFDIVTYTGNGNSTITVNHSLNSAPGCVMIKATSTATNWSVFHQSLGTNGMLFLNGTNEKNTFTGAFTFGTTSITIPLNPTVSPSGNSTSTNTNGVSYVAYLFASNAGGFGTSNVDNVITCGTFANNSSGDASVTLGYEPQWLMFKNISTTGNWITVDNMRGWFASPTLGDYVLSLNGVAVESNGVNYGYPSANGFTINNLGATVNNWIYIAVRRGPMKTPTSATSVFTNTIGNDTSAQTTNFPVDMVWDANPAGSTSNISIQNRLQLQYSPTFQAIAASDGNNVGWSSNTTVTPGLFGAANCIMNSFRRAPGFFDITTYTGNPSAAFYVPHNLGVLPQLAITKCTSTTGQWWVQYPFYDTVRDVFLDTSGAQGVYGYPFTFNSSSTATQLFFNTFGSNIDPCKTGASYVVYLFATLAGVSKVGTYTGTGALQTVDCGFTSGARFLLIKRLNAVGDWYVYNSASGISSSTDPYMLTNSSAAQTTGTNYVDTASNGFQVTAAASATINVSGGIYLFLAVA